MGRFCMVFSAADKVITRPYTISTLFQRTKYVPCVVIFWHFVRVFLLISRVERRALLDKLPLYFTATASLLLLWIGPVVAAWFVLLVLEETLSSDGASERSLWGRDEEEEVGAEEYRADCDRRESVCSAR